MVLNNDDTFSRCVKWLPSFFIPWTGEQIRHHGTTGFFVLSAPRAPVICFWYIFGAAVSEEQIPQTAVSVSIGAACRGWALWWDCSHWHCWPVSLVGYKVRHMAFSKFLKCRLTACPAWSFILIPTLFMNTRLWAVNISPASKVCEFSKPCR